MTQPEDLVKTGDYIVIQRQDYFKLHKVAANATVQLGKDVLDIKSIIDKPVWITYRMEPKKGGKRSYELIECSPDDQRNDSISLNTSTSGVDNRNILDDGSSQKLSMEEIVSLRDEGLSSKAIVGTLIENSKTFHSKTEYSQQKYLKKKEKKYFEYITIRKPSLRLVAEIMFRQDPGKVMGLRMDTLSQIPTAVNLHSHGTYLLYESGCQGLAAAALLNNLYGDGRLLLVHTGGIPQKQAVLALNLTEDQEKCLITVNIYNLLRKLRANDEEGESEGKTNSFKAQVLSDELETKIENSDSLETTTLNSEGPSQTSVDVNKNESTTEEEKVESATGANTDCKESCSGKRKHNDAGDQDDGSLKKKPRWEVEIDRAVKALALKADGLVLVCREHPGEVLKALLPFVAPSRNFVVYCQIREPLQELLLELKQRPDLINLRLTTTWLRTYQVESNRTHPLVNMTGSGGYLLTGVVVETVNK